MNRNMKVSQNARNKFYSQSQRTFRRAHREGTSGVRQGSAEEADRYICSQLGVVPVPSAGPWSTRSCSSLTRGVIHVKSKFFFFYLILIPQRYRIQLNFSVGN